MSVDRLAEYQRAVHTKHVLAIAIITNDQE
jgi:hypothetical protein